MAKRTTKRTTKPAKVGTIFPCGALLLDASEQVVAVTCDTPNRIAFEVSQRPQVVTVRHDRMLGGEVESAQVYRERWSELHPRFQEELAVMFSRA